MTTDYEFSTHERTAWLAVLVILFAVCATLTLGSMLDNTEIVTAPLEAAIIVAPEVLPGEPARVPVNWSCPAYMLYNGFGFVESYCAYI